MRGECIESILKNNASQHSDSNHLAQWVRNSHQIPPPDNEIPLEEWTREELAARAPKTNSPVSGGAQSQENTVEEQTAINSDVEQQSTTSSASLSTVKSNSVAASRKNGGLFQGSPKDCTGTGSINICRRCHRWSLTWRDDKIVCRMISISCPDQESVGNSIVD